MNIPLARLNSVTPVHITDVNPHAHGAAEMPGQPSQPTQASQSDLTAKAAARDGRMRQRLMASAANQGSSTSMASTVSKYAGFGAAAAATMAGVAAATGVAEAATVALAPVGIASVTVGAALGVTSAVLGGVKMMADQFDEHVNSHPPKPDGA